MLPSPLSISLQSFWLFPVVFCSVSDRNLGLWLFSSQATLQCAVSPWFYCTDVFYLRSFLCVQFVCHVLCVCVSYVAAHSRSLYHNHYSSRLHIHPVAMSTECDRFTGTSTETTNLITALYVTNLLAVPPHQILVILVTIIWWRLSVLSVFVVSLLRGLWAQL